ncbi:hypothetical protein [Niallia sp.]|uniref:hypothetical protein n=1 Tax=Niallia sp. TaxID=2837523 RepID=UPI00289E2D8F|nr:hypothetical protein [Niallia sp.]
MAFDINEHYDFDTFYTREKDLIYSNRYTKKEKWGNIFSCILFFSMVAALIGLAVYVYSLEKVVWPIFLIGLGAMLPAFIGVIIATTTRKIHHHEVVIELQPMGFTQTIKNQKTTEIQELYLPFEKMESVTMGRFLYVVNGRKYSPGTYWHCIELAMKGLTLDGKMVLKKFLLKNPDEIDLWISQFQQNNITIYFTETLLKDLTLEDYDKLNKVKYPEETGDIALAYKTEGQKAPVNWDGKRIYH